MEFQSTPGLKRAQEGVHEEVFLPRQSSKGRSPKAFIDAFYGFYINGTNLQVWVEANTQT